MKQLLIVKSSEALNTTSIASLKPGALCIVRLKDNAVIDGSTSERVKLEKGKNVCIALGRPTGKGEFASGEQQNNFIIPEVDTNTLSIVKALPIMGQKYSATIAMPTPTVPTEANKVNEYSLRLFKKNVVPHDRNAWDFMVPIKLGSTITTATKLADAMVKVFEENTIALDIKISRTLNSANANATYTDVADIANYSANNNEVVKYTGSTNATHTYGHFYKATVSGSPATTTWTDVTSTDGIKVEGTTYQDWELKGLDLLSAVTVTQTGASKPIGDAEYIKDLAIQCAGDKGYFYTHAEGREYIPGFPEDVESFTLNASGSSIGDSLNRKYSTTGYSIYTLRFQVGRNSAKTRDEKVWQLVHIAVPLSNASVSTLNTIFADFM